MQRARIHRDRFCPADQRQVGGQRNQRKEQRADWIDVDDRIERQPSEPPRRRIAKPIGRPGMRRFMKRQGKQEDQ
jgi:hypothetical protein